jgi:hypothetical protein
MSSPRKVTDPERLPPDVYPLGTCKIGGVAPNASAKWSPEVDPAPLNTPLTGMLDGPLKLSGKS